MSALEHADHHLLCDAQAAASVAYSGLLSLQLPRFLHWHAFSAFAQVPEVPVPPRSPGATAFVRAAPDASSFGMFSTKKKCCCSGKGYKVRKSDDVTDCEKPSKLGIYHEHPNSS